MNNWHDLNETLRSWFGVAAPQAGLVAGADEDLARAQARLSLALPAAYARWWREQGGLLNEVWNVQDTLHAPDALCLAADAPGKLLIAHENQSVVRWAFDLADWADIGMGQAAPADPPVWVEDAEEAGSWRLEAESFSAWRWPPSSPTRRCGVATAAGRKQPTEPRLNACVRNWRPLCTGALCTSWPGRRRHGCGPATRCCWRAMATPGCG